MIRVVDKCLHGLREEDIGNDIPGAVDIRDGNEQGGLLLPCPFELQRVPIHEKLHLLRDQGPEGGKGADDDTLHGLSRRRTELLIQPEGQVITAVFSPVLMKQGVEFKFRRITPFLYPAQFQQAADFTEVLAAFRHFLQDIADKRGQQDLRGLVPEGIRASASLSRSVNDGMCHRYDILLRMNVMERIVMAGPLRTDKVEEPDPITLLPQVIPIPVIQVPLWV